MNMMLKNLCDKLSDILNKQTCQEKSIVSQRLVYDTLASNNVRVHEFQVSQELREKLYTYNYIIIKLTLLWKKIIVF